MSTKALSITTADRLVTEAGHDTDTLERLHKRIGGAYAAGTDGWSVTVSRYTRAANVAEVYGDTRSKDSAARMSVKAFAEGFGVTGPMVARWHRAGWALEVGVGEGDVKVYLRSPSKYDTEVIDDALRNGDVDALRKGQAAKDAAREAAKAERDAAKADETDEPQVTTKDGKSTVVAVDIIGVVTAALSAMTAEDVTRYVSEHGSETAAEFAGSLRLAAEVVDAAAAEYVGAEIADMDDVDAVA